ncbi:unnamed protein product [Natator depressus]
MSVGVCNQAARYEKESHAKQSGWKWANVSPVLGLPVLSHCQRFLYSTIPFSITRTHLPIHAHPRLVEIYFYRPEIRAEDNYFCYNLFLCIIPDLFVVLLLCSGSLLH